MAGLSFPVFSIKFVRHDGKSLDGKFTFNLPENDSVGAWHTRKKKALELHKSGFHSVHLSGIGHCFRELYTGAERCFLVEISGRFDHNDSCIVSENIRFIKELPLNHIRSSISVSFRDDKLNVTGPNDMLNENIRNVTRFLNSISSINSMFYVASPSLLNFIIKKPNHKFKSFDNIGIS